tara:strand:- start:24 stop:1064 length:1041 start_codon:yes stop_codon:yes gene_type:complete
MEKKFFKNREEKNFIHNKKIIAKFPKNALVELTNACNHECVFCANPKMERSISRIDINLFSSFVKNAVKNGLEELGLYTTGEPFMTKNLHEFIEISKKNGVKRIYITTNGSLASLEKVKKCIDKGLNSIKFSINGGTRETYKIIHGKDDFDKVFQNINDIYNYNLNSEKKIQLLCSFVTTKLTEKEIPEFKRKYSKYFEDIMVTPTYNQGGRIDGDSFNKKNEVSHKKKLTKEQINSAKPCEYLWERAVLSAEGNLTACCGDYENDLIYAKYDPKIDLLDQYNSKSMLYLREKHLNKNLDNTICKNCVFNTKEKFEKLQNISFKKQKFNPKKITHLQNRIKTVNNS